MKLKFTILFLWIFGVHTFAQDHSFDLLKENTKTKVLYDRVFAVSKATELQPYKISSQNFLQVYHEMQRADFLERLPKLDVIKSKADEGFIQQYIPLSVLIADFENISKSAMESNKLTLNSKNQYVIKDGSQQIFDQNKISLMSSLLAKTKSANPQFILKSDLIFNISARPVSFFEIKDGKTWKVITPDQPFELSCPQNGMNEVFYKIHFKDGTVLEQSFIIDVQYQKRSIEGKGTKSFEPNVVTTINSTIPYKGYGETAAYNGTGEYEVYMGSDGVLDKPIILVDGFDPGDTRNTAGIYQMLNYGTGQNLGDLIRAQGYDIIVLNFPVYTRPGTSTIIDGGVDYIQRNAMILVELLNQINAAKSGSAKNVVIGPSMGGLISRYALRYMEQNSINPDTRLYLSFDSPHMGANVPLGFQHLFNYMGFGPIGDTTMQQVVNGMLKSPAAKEMLLDHFEGHLLVGSTTDFDPNKVLPAGAPNYRTPFQNELDAMGFPQTTRNISISNGAGNGTMTGTPGMVAMDHTFNTSSTQRAIIKTTFTPAKNQTLQIDRFQGQQWLVFFWFTAYDAGASAKSPATSDGLDSAPGGRFDISKFAGNAAGNPMLTEFLNNLKIMYFNFIPAVSSMAVSNTGGNYYANINSSSTTPFAAYYVPTANEDHVTLNDPNVQFALNEILNDQTLATGNQMMNDITIENPVRNSLKIKTGTSLKNAVITIADTSGRTVLSENRDLNGFTEIPVKLTNGVYMLTIDSGKQKTVKKIIINH